MRGHLGNNNPNGISFRPEDVQRVLRELWVGYVADNRQLFATGDLKSAEREHHRRSDVRPAVIPLSVIMFSPVASVQNRVLRVLSLLTTLLFRS